MLPHYGSVNSKRDDPPPPGHLSFFFLNNVANAPRWGQLIRTNPHGGAPGRVQTLTHGTKSF